MITYCGRRGGEENEATEVGSTLVAKGGSSVEESTDTVGLEAGADKGSAPGDGRRSSLLGTEELLLGVGSLGALVGLAEEGSKD